MVLTLGSLVAWCALVWFAIKLGPDVKSGESAAIALLVVASIGAMACLFLALVQGSKILAARRVPVEATPPRPVGGRRAKR